VQFSPKARQKQYYDEGQIYEFAEFNLEETEILDGDVLLDRYYFLIYSTMSRMAHYLLSSGYF
jgi:hypothetical protein